MKHIQKSNHIVILILSIIVITLIILSSVSIIFYQKINNINRSVSKLEETIKTVSVASDKKEENNIFVLREYEGIIGIYDDNGVLIDIINVNIKSLPEADRNMLQAGIYALSRNELISLREDYTG